MRTSIDPELLPTPLNSELAPMNCGCSSSSLFGVVVSPYLLSVGISEDVRYALSVYLSFDAQDVAFGSGEMVLFCIFLDVVLVLPKFSLINVNLLLRVPAPNK
jgi:hypothetical protein